MDRFTRTQRNVTQRGNTLAELFKLLWQRKLWWLMPLVALFILVALTLIFANTAGVFAPFLYTVF